MERFIREDECRRITGLSRTTRWRESRRGMFPRKYKISKSATAYKESEVMAWLDLCSQEVKHV